MILDVTIHDDTRRDNHRTAVGGLGSVPGRAQAVFGYSLEPRLASCSTGKGIS